MVVEQMDWMREPQPVGQMNAVPTLVADGVQIGKRQRAKIWALTYRSDEASAAQLSKSRSGAMRALLGVRTTMR